LQCDSSCREKLYTTWENLAKDWQGHPFGLVAMIDCASADDDDDEMNGNNNNNNDDDESSTRMICDEFEVVSYPSVYWGDPHSPEPYPAEHLLLDDYSSLSTFAKAHIATPVCSASRLEYCDTQQQQLIHQLMGMKQSELEEIEMRVEEQLTVAQHELDEQLRALTQQYQVLVQTFNQQIDIIRDETKFKWVQQVLVLREQQDQQQDVSSGGGAGNEAAREEL
jgi:hypothetical protein